MSPKFKNVNKSLITLDDNKATKTEEMMSFSQLSGRTTERNQDEEGEEVQEIVE